MLSLYAGFFLFLVQPFRIGDRVGVSCSAPSGGGLLGLETPAATPSGSAVGWFEGVCEQVDLRYTVIRQVHAVIAELCETTMQGCMLVCILLLSAEALHCSDA